MTNIAFDVFCAIVVENHSNNVLCNRGSGYLINGTLIIQTLILAICNPVNPGSEKEIHSIGTHDAVRNRIYCAYIFTPKNS